MNASSPSSPSASSRSPSYGAPAPLSRRTFLRHACCAAVGTTGIFSALTQLQALAAVAGDATEASTPGDYKALVCLFLQGGNDATNLLVPYDAASHAAYARARAELALPRDTLLPISTRAYNDGRSYALHPAVSDLHSLYGAGKVALLANVGTLVRPTTLADYRAGRNLPPQLFAHSEQLLQWQSSLPDRPFETGWGGRLADLTDTLNANRRVSMSITLSGVNAFLRGKAVNQFAVSPDGVRSLNYGNIATDLSSTAIRAMMANQPGNALAAAFGGTTLEAIDQGDALGAALAGAPTLRTSFQYTETAQRLAMVARIISVASQLGLRRQVFFVQLGGWDLHGAQDTAHGPLLAELSGALKSFYDATVELGVAEQVTTFTASDFGRTYVPNAGGTDHGWGNHQLIMGGAVRGGDIYGRLPSLTLGADDDTGRGRWLPTTSVDEYNATLATWFGISPTNLSLALPNIGRFATPNLGFV